MRVMPTISEALLAMGPLLCRIATRYRIGQRSISPVACRRKTRNAEGLEAILADFFGIPTEIRELEGYWMKIPKENQCRLGESPETGSLGLNAVAGERKYEVQLKFRIRMGPMEIEDLHRLVPIGDSFRRLQDWVLNYVNHEFYWDLQCVVKAAAVPALTLGGGRVARLDDLVEKPAISLEILTMRFSIRIFGPGNLVSRDSSVPI